MQSLRIVIPLDEDELKALVSMAKAACRHPREQLRFLLREEARRRGLLAAVADNPMPQQSGSIESLTKGTADEYANQ